MKREKLHEAADRTFNSSKSGEIKGGMLSKMHSKEGNGGGTLLELLAPREPRPLPPIILTSAIAGWGLTRNFDDGLQTSKLVVKLQRLNIGFQDKIPPD